MTLAVQHIEQTRVALGAALAQQDWEAIARLDLECREHVDAAMVEPLDDDSDLKRSLEGLLVLYRELVHAVTRQREDVAGEILRVNRSHQGAKVYQMFG
ncbi:flagellar protein FliT [Pseudomonas sp. PDNC002]|uniref:flagellar protein FliT n=1 Tax=Pseudomonas sp. PDNC002 TaxID=2811422 RepID=UPI001962A932|nr:flagellar protein FliT [Pseudomonas sp. PDNC002]QRY82157.1 flagellar protein FliT [Pseudomonas sp. PDNC002]